MLLNICKNYRSVTLFIDMYFFVSDENKYTLNLIFLHSSKDEL